jgi:Trk-type K+ transport system membrane component
MIRQVLMGTALAVATSLPIFAPPPAAAQGGPFNIHAIISDYCSAFGNFGLSHGGCVSYLE